MKERRNVMINNLDYPKCEKRPADGFRKNLYFYRKSQKISGRELAEFCHISYQMISKYECGLRTPTPAVLVLLAQKLGVSVDTLLLGETECVTDELTA